MEQRLDTMRNMKYEVQEMMIDKSVEDEDLDGWVSSKDIEAIRAVCYQYYFFMKKKIKQLKHKQKHLK